MTNNSSIHTFHIPVMGLAYTIDSPIRIAHYGISSVISIMDDDLIEKMNAFYSKKFSLPYREITKKIEDYRAKRITSYLNLVDRVVTTKFNAFKADLAESRQVLQDYIDLLPGKSEIRKGLESFLHGNAATDGLGAFIDKHLSPGSIDVNIMTKVDRENFANNTRLPDQFNDAHAALRGFANSSLQSSVILSAGLNPRLFSYFEEFPDFYPDQEMVFRKKIIIKVSDFRSAMVQGSFFAKKGLWVSEFRIESGLNCGGHAFASDGALLGPVLDEFMAKRSSLAASMHELLCKALQHKGLPVPASPPALRITVQGGVGTAEEHDFLLGHYNTDSVGWGSPFLLVPEATSTDSATRELLAKAKEEDLYISEISPLGVPFNTVRGTTNEQVRHRRISHGKPGSPCPKKYLALNKEFGPEGICTASSKYQKIALAALDKGEDSKVNDGQSTVADAITAKSCLCVGLANASLLENNISIKGDQSVIVCPGPNIAYFDRQYTLKEMVQHIYGHLSVLENSQRPNLFVKELRLYINFLKSKVLAAGTDVNLSRQLAKIKENLSMGIGYYNELFSSVTAFKDNSEINYKELVLAEKELSLIHL
jgi:hypothetical protein